MRGSKTKAFQAKRPPGPERGVDALEDAPPVGPGRQVEQRAEGEVDQPGRLVELELAHVALAAARDRPRPRRRARRACASIAGDASIPSTCRPVSRATGIATRPLPTASSTSGPSRLAGELDVERNVLGHVRRPVVVDRREGVVEAHEADGIVARWTPRRSRTKRGPRSRRPPTRTRSRSSAFATSGARARSSSRCARYATARRGWR